MLLLLLLLLLNRLVTKVVLIDDVDDDVFSSVTAFDRIQMELLRPLSDLFVCTVESTD